MNQTKTAKRLLILLIAAAAMSLTACGGGGDDGSSKVQTATQAITQVTATTTPEQAIAIFGTPSTNNSGPVSDGTLQVIIWTMPDGTLVQMNYKNGKLWQLITSDATPDHNRTGFIQF